MSLSPDGHLQIFTIYSHPADYPEIPYLVRASTIRGDESVPGDVLGTATTLTRARSLVPPEADYRIPRATGDSPTIVETWM